MALEIRSSDRQPGVLKVGAVTARALIIGVLLLVLADLYINWGTLVLRASKLNKSYFPMGLFFPFVVLVLANAGVHRFGLRALSTGELRVILDPNGYIITNAHVVEGAQRIRVILSAAQHADSPRRSILNQTGRVLGAQLVRIDRETDLAVLKINATDLPTLSLADSDALYQGQLVFAFGSPLGLQNSVSMGVVSAVARQLEPESPMIYIQTDAPINPGNSGGPLIDVQGRVVGINTLIFSQSGGNEGIGFAAPSNIVRNVFNQIRNTGRVRRGDIGVSAQTITTTMATALHLPQTWGVILGDVFPLRPAHEAGLKTGDIVLSLNGKVMENGRQFHVNLYNKPAGEKVTLEILRGSEKQRIEVAVTERPDDPERFADLVHPKTNRISVLGILGINLTTDLKRLFPVLRSANGVVVAAIFAGGPGWAGGLQPGDIIHAVNGMPISGLEALRDMLRGIAAPVVLHIERNNRLWLLEMDLE